MNDLFNAPDQGSYFERLVGEGKKFSDQEALAKSKYEADSHIENLTREKSELYNDYVKLRDEYNARQSLQELVDQVKAQSNQTSNELPKVNDGMTKPAEVDPNQIKSLVRDEILLSELERKQTDNFNMVESKIRERFGEDYQKALNEQMKELGLNKDIVNDLARNNPKVLIKALGLDQQAQRFDTPPRSSQRSDNFAPNTQKRTWSYYQKMRAENPKLYHDPKTQLQLNRDAAALGEEFQDGDWHLI